MSTWPKDTPEPNWDALRAEREQNYWEAMALLQAEWGLIANQSISNHKANACYCTCGIGRTSSDTGTGSVLCEHTWDGPDWTSEDGCAQSSTCSRCGTLAMSHTMRCF